MCLVNLAPFVMVMVEKRRRWEGPYWEMEENEGHSLCHYLYICLPLPYVDQRKEIESSNNIKL